MLLCVAHCQYRRFICSWKNFDEHWHASITQVFKYPKHEIVKKDLSELALHVVNMMEYKNTRRGLDLKKLRIAQNIIGCHFSESIYDIFVCIYICIHNCTVNIGRF
mmetsp:Transcript_39873/g.46652  ORF Transcript_39873/g.46652 Transcript_39873/m.46652 type:complete len:106 (+) Transcript_39873:2121-2438(+)